MTEHTTSAHAPSAHTTLADMAAHFEQMLPMFDALKDVVFFVKDREAHYVLVNATLIARCGLKSKKALIGKRADQVFPSRFGQQYSEQDETVVRCGLKLVDRLELHLYPGREPGWCLTSKSPLRDRDGRVLGIVGMSRDLHAPEHSHAAYARIAVAANHIQDHYAQPLRIPEIAQLTRLSIVQLERYFQKVFQLTPRQMLLKARLDAASVLLADGESSITDIAARCGYSDHSAFTRQFKMTMGATPSQFRQFLRSRTDVST